MEFCFGLVAADEDDVVGSVDGGVGEVEGGAGAGEMGVVRMDGLEAVGGGGLPVFVEWVVATVCYGVDEPKGVSVKGEVSLGGGGDLCVVLGVLVGGGDCVGCVDGFEATAHEV